MTGLDILLWLSIGVLALVFIVMLIATIISIAIFGVMVLIVFGLVGWFIAMIWRDLKKDKVRHRDDRPYPDGRIRPT